jgi:bifunctional autolysin
MPLFIKENIRHFVKNNGTKETSFEIIKGKNGVVEQIKGVSDKDMYRISKRKIVQNKDSGKIYATQKVFKIKSSNLKDLLQESRKLNNHNKKYKKNSNTHKKESTSKKESTLKKESAPKKELKPKKESAPKKELKPKKESKPKKELKSKKDVDSVSKKKSIKKLKVKSSNVEK